MARGRPRQGEESKSTKDSVIAVKGRARKSAQTQKSGIKAAPQKLAPPSKRKSSTDAIEATPMVRKRARGAILGPEPSSSRPSVAHAPPPAPQPSGDEFAYASATRVLDILRDAMSAADSEVRRQMAMNSAGPSHIGLEDLMALLLAGVSDEDVNRKGKERRQ